MADILNGTSGHASFAPLSNAQTISICKHLQDGITDLGSQCDSLRSDLKHATEQIKAVATQLANYSVDDLREHVTSIDNQVSGLRNDLGRTTANLQRLQKDHDDTRDAMSNIRDTQKVADTKAHQLAAEILQVSSSLKGLDQVVHTKVVADARELQAELDKTRHQVGLVLNDLPLLKDGAQAQKEALQVAQDMLRGLQADMAMGNTGADLLERKVDDLGAGLKETQRNLGDLDVSFARLREDHEGTKANLSAVGSGLKKTAARLKQEHEALAGLMREVRGAKAKLDCATTTLDITRRDLEGAKDKVRSLNDTQDMSSAVQMKLLKQLEETSTFANRTAESLKETNSLVLPNLKLDVTLPRGTTGFGTCDSRAATARETRRPTPTFNKERPVMDYSRQAQAGM